MSLFRNFGIGLRSLFRRNQVDRELDEELSAYLEMEAAEKIRQGVSRNDALREVRLERGSLEVTKELVRSGGWELFVETCWQDLRFAARILRKSPVFTAVAVLTLTLGIGATTAIFSVVDAVLLRSLPYRDPQRLVSIFEDMSSVEFLHKPVSAGTYVDLKAEKELFEDVAAGADHEDDLIDSSGEARALTAEQVTHNLFSVLVAKPLLGRDILPGENSRGTAPWIQIVGLVANVKQMGLSVPSRQEIYLPYLQTQGNYMWPRALVTRTSGDPRRTLEGVRQAVKSVDPEEPLDNVRTMDEIVDQETSQSQMQTILLTGL
jgi:MacB-like periplasmic core domain